jgi:hypothetical protein
MTKEKAGIAPGLCFVRCHAPRRRGIQYSGEIVIISTAAAYWIVRSRLRQGFDGACGPWLAEALAEAASRTMTAVAHFASARLGGVAGHDLISVS